MSPQRHATLALIVATFFWGAGFTWAKAGGEAINRAAGAGTHAVIGPIFLLGVRFLLAGGIWFAIFPQSRRGWTRAGVVKGCILGVILALSMSLQHLGLDRTSEAVSAFLTSLTVLFVPLFVTLLFRKAPRPIAWVGVGLAIVGIWLMTGASPAGFGVGEVLGLACAVAYAMHILAINIILKHEDSWRMTGAQFLVVGIITSVWSLFAHAPADLPRLIVAEGVPTILLLMIAFPSFVAFGFMLRFQPLIDPTRAAILYLVEPIFAAGYAWLQTGRGLSAMEWTGAGLILVANVLVEFLSPRKIEK